MTRKLHSATLIATIAIALTALIAPGVTSAHGTAAVSPQGEKAEAANCVIHTLPGLLRQGEFKQVGDVGDIVEVECNPAVFPGGTPVEIGDAQLFSRCSLSGGTITWVDPNEFNTGAVKTTTGKETVVELDGNGNANVALVAGPNCAVGDTVVSAHTQVGNGNTMVESFAAGFAVEPAKPTPEGATVLPTEQVEDESSSSVATLVQVEFASTEAKVRIAAPELFSRCEVPPHLTWLRPNGEVVTGVKELAGGTATEPTGTEALRTDDDGNAFVIVLGTSSCKPGKSYFEVDLEESPFTTEEPAFTVLPPQPTPEPSFTLDKLQRIGTGTTFKTEKLSGTVGETVEYEIIVTNTGTVPETFTKFVDEKCDKGTISGGPTGPVGEGESTTYKCTRALTTTGTFTNVAEITGGTVGGRPTTKPTNEVEVEVPEPAKPAFKVEKLQKITGPQYTTSPLTGAVGQTVYYEIVATNTGNVPLNSVEIEDGFCEHGTIAGGPAGMPVGVGGSTTWTCSRMLTTPGTAVNVASVTGTPPGGTPITEPSQPVEVTVPGKGTPSFAVEKLQRIGSTSTYTTEQLHGSVGETVEYEIVVANTGTTTLTVSTPNDPYCDAGTLSGPTPAGPTLEPGHTATYTCTRLLTAEGTYTNVATVIATPPGGTPVEQPSPPVQVGVPVTQKQVVAPPPPNEPKKQVIPEKCMASPIVVQGATGPKRGTFVVHVNAPGVKTITFYVDGHKLATLQNSSKHPGRFTLKVNARKLAHGAHRLSYTAIRESKACAKAAGAKVFVKPFSAAVKPRFTG